jgi:hypothetical protein
MKVSLHVLFSSISRKRFRASAGLLLLLSIVFVHLADQSAPDGDDTAALSPYVENGERRSVVVHQPPLASTRAEVMNRVFPPLLRSDNTVTSGSTRTLPLDFSSSASYSLLGRFSNASADHLFALVANGPPQIHVLCCVFYRNGTYPTLLRAWDNFHFPQHREDPFFAMTAAIMTQEAHFVKLARDLPACFYLQDSLDDALHTTSTTNGDEILDAPDDTTAVFTDRPAFLSGRAADGPSSFEVAQEEQAPILSNLERPGMLTVSVPDHTFSVWRAAKTLAPFDAFYAQALHNSSATANRVSFRRRKPAIFWRGQQTSAGGVRGTSGKGRTRLLASLLEPISSLKKQETLQAAESKTKKRERDVDDEEQDANSHGDEVDLDVSAVSVYFTNASELRRTAFVPLLEHAEYRYLLDLPGYGYSGRLKYLLLLGSVVLVVDHPDREYWLPFFCPWVHYVPVRRDLSDLQQAARFLETNLAAAERIAESGRELARRMFHPNFRAAYFSDVLGAYSRGEALRLRGVRLGSAATTSRQCLTAVTAKYRLAPLACPPRKDQQVRIAASGPDAGRGCPLPASNSEPHLGVVELEQLLRRFRHVCLNVSISVSQVEQPDAKVESVDVLSSDDGADSSTASLLVVEPMVVAFRELFCKFSSETLISMVNASGANNNSESCSISFCVLVPRLPLLRDAPQQQGGQRGRRNLAALSDQARRRGSVLALSLPVLSATGGAVVPTFGIPDFNFFDSSGSSSQRSSSCWPMPSYTRFYAHQKRLRLDCRAGDPCVLPFFARRKALFYRAEPVTGARHSSCGMLDVIAAQRLLLRAEQRVDDKKSEIYWNVTVCGERPLSRGSQWEGWRWLLEHAEYRYLLDLPGYGYSGRLKYLLLLGSVVLVVDHPDREYWLPFFCPWVHYVPVRRDLSDLDVVLARLEADPALAQTIARASRERAMERLSPDDVQRDAMLGILAHLTGVAKN